MVFIAVFDQVLRYLDARYPVWSAPCLRALSPLNITSHRTAQIIRSGSSLLACLRSWISRVFGLPGAGCIMDLCRPFEFALACSCIRKDMIEMRLIGGRNAYKLKVNVLGLG